MCLSLPARQGPFCHVDILCSKGVDVRSFGESCRAPRVSHCVMFASLPGMLGTMERGEVESFNDSLAFCIGDDCGSPWSRINVLG